MKRLNPETNAPFKYGDVRSDGHVFLTYYPSKIKRDGYYAEAWLHPDKFENNRRKNASNSRAIRQELRGRLLALYHAAQHNSKKRDHDKPTLTVQDLHDLWDRQSGLCAYTLWPMCFETRHDRLVSLDRIDNTKGYTKENVVLVCWCINRGRSNMDQTEFFAMCKAVTDTQSRVPYCES